MLVHLARIHLARKDLDAARSAYESAIEITPDDGLLLREYKNLLRKLGLTTTGELIRYAIEHRLTE